MSGIALCLIITIKYSTEYGLNTAFRVKMVESKACVQSVTTSVNGSRKRVSLYSVFIVQCRQYIFVVYDTIIGTKDTEVLNLNISLVLHIYAVLIRTVAGVIKL